MFITPRTLEFEFLGISADPFSAGCSFGGLTSLSAILDILSKRKATDRVALLLLK